MIRTYAFLTDENIPLEVFFNLKEQGIDIQSISLLNPGADDEAVLTTANNDRRVLITFDKDFGELIFRKRKAHHGVILLRIHPQSVENILFRIYKLFSLVSSTGIDLSISFCVVEENRMRMRSL